MHGALDSAHIPAHFQRCDHWEIIMFAIIGIVVVFDAVLGGYLMEHGNVKVLLQPAELLIIEAPIANPLHILKHIAARVAAVFKGSTYTKHRYIDSLHLTYQLLNKARRQGLMSLETDVEEPDKSPIFSKDAEFLKNHHVRYFFATACGWRSAASKLLNSTS